MKITKIVKIGNQDNFAIFIDNKYSLNLDGESLLHSNIALNQVISEEQLHEIKELGEYYSLYNKSINYLSNRLKSEGEIREYLKRKNGTIAQINKIVKRLKDLDLINDQKYAISYIHDRMLQTPISKRKINFELQKRKIAKEIIVSSLANDQISDLDNLKKLVQIKRQSSRYKDNLKLMQYLVRNGFNYQDVKEILKDASV